MRQAALFDSIRVDALARFVLKQTLIVSMLSTIGHPNISHGPIGIGALPMQVIGTLATEIQELGARSVEPVELQWLVSVVMRACDVLAHARARGVLHADLNPSCVLIDGNGDVSVRSRSSPSDQCAAYYSTEQAWGRRANIDARTDVYAFGGMLFAIMTLRAPHEHDGDATRELASARLGIVPSPQSVCARDLPQDLCRITTRALAASPTDRYPSIALLKQDLQRFMLSWAIPAGGRQIAIQGCVSSAAQPALPM